MYGRGKWIGSRSKSQALSMETAAHQHGPCVELRLQILQVQGEGQGRRLGQGLHGTRFREGSGAGFELRVWV